MDSKTVKKHDNSQTKQQYIVTAVERTSLQEIVSIRFKDHAAKIVTVVLNQS